MSTYKPAFGERVLVIPDTKFVTRDPQTGAVVPAEGTVVKFSPFWGRRVDEGAVIVEQPTQRPVAPAEVPEAAPSTIDAGAVTAAEIPSLDPKA